MGAAGDWLISQTNHVDDVRRDAARHICSRWNPTSEFFNFARVMRTLQAEDSDHLLGARYLASDYAEAYGDAAVKQLGQVPIPANQLTHFEEVTCAKCRRQAVPGSDRCGRHGGQLITTEDLERISRNTAHRIVDATDRAVGVLLDTMDNGDTAEANRAARFILDRAFQITANARAQTDEAQTAQMAKIVGSTLVTAIAALGIDPRSEQAQNAIYTALSKAQAESGNRGVVA